MGVRRLLAWAAFALAAALCGFASAGPAAARPLQLAEAVCVGGAGSVESAFGLDPSALDCSGAHNRSEPFLRGRVEIARVGTLPPGRLIWQTDPSSFASMLIRLDYADGSQRLIDVDAQMAVRNWDANGQFWVAIQQEAAALTAIDVVVERPQSRAIFTRMTVSPFAEASAHNYARTLLYVLLCGTLLVPILYDLVFYRVLRARFMLWHLVMTTGTLLYVLFNSGLLMVLTPDISSFHRFVGRFLAIALIILGSARFLLLIIEEGRIGTRVQNALRIAAAVNFSIALVMVIDIEVFRMWIVDAFFLSILPVIAATLMALATALARGSRVAVYLSLAYAGLILAGLAQILATMGLFERSNAFDEAIYAGLVVLVLGTSAGVGDRFLVIKAERDRAWLSAKKLTAMANSDGLTGLLNRRAFDQTRRLASGRGLLVADLDRFKAINDTYGHQRGDAVLRHAARTIEQAVTAHGGGEVYRLGGEEFAILTPPITPAGLAKLAEAVRAEIERAADHDEAFDMPQITVSIGGVMGGGQLMHVAFSEADGALYHAKESGRNRSEISDLES